DNSLHQEVTTWRIPSTPIEDKVFLDVIRKRINVTDNNMSEFEFSITVDNSENLGSKSYDVAIFRVFPGSSANQQIGRSVLSSQNPQCQFYISAGRYDIPEIAIQPRRDVNDS
ncbi:MAG: hypothetical protein OEY89_12875, partial [Gammaproteobacteria bacterium]|nr:hypothetical protein [Gammaproteobacteria bacterium]